MVIGSRPSLFLADITQPGVTLKVGQPIGPVRASACLFALGVAFALIRATTSGRVTLSRWAG